MATVLFYYKDIALIQSLYAQLFSGLLQEILTIEGNGRDDSLGVEGSGDGSISAMIAKGTLGVKASGNSTARFSESKQETTIPHDAMILDVLEKLGPIAKSEISTAKRGDIINVDGYLIFFPKELEINSLQPMLPFLEAAVASQVKNLDKKQKQAIIDILKNFLKTGSGNCRFIFRTKTGYFLTGYLKNSDFNEDSLSLFFRYKGSMIPCQMIGIFEQHPNKPILEEQNQVSIFHGLAQLQTAAAEIWNQGMPDSTTVTPIAFFLPLNANKNESASSE